MGVGGAQRVKHALLKHADRSRFEVHVCAVRPLLPKEAIEGLGEGLNFHSLNMEGRVTWRREWRVIPAVSRIARTLRPDVLHISDSAMLYALTPIFPNSVIKGKVLNIHIAPQARRRTGLYSVLGGWMTRRLCYTPLVHSRSVLIDVARAYRVPPSAVTIIPLGVDTGYFASPGLSRADWRARHGIPGDAAVVVYVCRLEPVKNVGLYVDVASKVLEKLDAFFLVVGDGLLRQSLQEAIEARGLQHRVRLLGQRSGVDLVDVYHTADLFLCTSNYESSSLVIMEAMAAGKPVVSTAVGGVRDLVDDGVTGHLCPAGDANALAQAVIEILRDPIVRQRLGIAAQERARQTLDVGIMVRKHEELYARLADGAGPRGS